MGSFTNSIEPDEMSRQDLSYLNPAYNAHIFPLRGINVSCFGQLVPQHLANQFDQELITECVRTT